MSRGTLHSSRLFLQIAIAAGALGVLFPAAGSVRAATVSVRPDIIVAADGTGDFKTVESAVASIPTTNRDRITIFIKNGTYHEKVRLDAPFVTLRGESRTGTRIEFAQLNDDFGKHPDDLGRAVLNLSSTANDAILQNLTVENTAHAIGPHAFAVYGTADRTIITDADILSDGADTLSLWNGKSGRYYHARCNFRGSVDFVCPRGWCYITDSTFYEMKDTAATWHDGHQNKSQKFVLRHCTFDGASGWNLARHHNDAQFFYLDCTFSKTMVDKAPFRVIYPLNGGVPTEADKERNAKYDKLNLWGERAYFFNCHRTGGDYAWMKDNLADAPGSPSPDQITARWTFDNTWNPEATDPPRLGEAAWTPAGATLTFSEPVTVKGKPRVRFDGGSVGYQSGSGTNTLVFGPLPAGTNLAAKEMHESLDLPEGAAILATQATVVPRVVTNLNATK